MSNQSGFHRQRFVSQKMAEFAGWPLDEKKSRIEITAFLKEYIETNNLQDPTGRIILPDKKLSDLLGLCVDQTNYAELQKYISNRLLA